MLEGLLTILVDQFDWLLAAWWPEHHRGATLGNELTEWTTSADKQTGLMAILYVAPCAEYHDLPCAERRTLLSIRIDGPYG